MTAASRRSLINLILILLAFLVFGQLAQASESALHSRGYFVDSTGQITLDEAKSKTFEPFERALSLGFRSETVWLRIKIDSEFDLYGADFYSKVLVLRLSNPLLDEVRLYDPILRGNEPTTTGDAYPITNDELYWPSLTFLLPRLEVSRDIYISIKSSNSLVFSVSIDTINNAIKKNQTYNLFGGLYLGLLVVFFVLAIALRVGRADKVINMFIAQQILAIAWSFSLMGYTRQYVGPLLGLNSVDSITNIIIVAYTFSVAQFGMLFLSQFKLRIWACKIVYLPVILCVPVVIMMILGYESFALFINALSIICVSILGMLCAIFAVDWKTASARAFPRGLVIFFYVLFGVATPLATSVTLQVEPFFQNAFSGFFFTSATAGLLMSSLLLFRARTQGREALATKMALSLQQQRNQEQAKFIGMLAHEFKTPLSIIKMVVGSGQLDARSAKYSEEAIRNINALLEKCLQAEAMIDSSSISESVAFNIETLTREIILSFSLKENIAFKSEYSMEIRSDPTLFRIILTNLIDNAFKYGASNDSVRVSIRTLSNVSVAVRITNRIGRTGVPDAIRIFEKYYRSPSALSQSGSGLGLYLSKYIAKLLGGDLLFGSDKEEVWFEVRLPR